MSRKASYPTIISLLILLSLAVVCSSARAESISLNIPFPPPVVEGADGALVFTVTNIDTVNVTIDFVRLSTPPPSFQFFAGEIADAVTGTMITPIGNTCVGVPPPPVVLAPGGTCTFTQLFQTADRSPDSDVDDGFWMVFNEVGFTRPGVIGFNTGAGLVDVTDPVPEPASLTLFGIGVLLMIAVNRRFYSKPERNHGIDAHGARGAM